MSGNQQLVLVTGGSGFIAGHCVLRLLDAGYKVRATVRSLRREAEVRDVLADAGMTRGDDLSFVAADLTGDAGWAAAVSGCDHVLHVASPVAPGHVEDEDAVIAPARDGTLRVLRAARDAGVGRVVLTSAFHAVGFGHPHSDHVFTEDDWSVLDGPGMDAYGRSKVIAERAAWDFARAEGVDLTSILPVAVMGPVMGQDVSGSNHIVQRMLSGKMPVLPNLWIPIVDVRDVADAHVLALASPEAAGERILVAGGPALSMKQIAAVLREHLGEAARRVPTRGVPDFVVRVAARFTPEFRSIAPDLGYAKKVSGEKARALLGLDPRDPEDAIVAAAESMSRRALIPA